jgi:hypothetical protein
MTRARARKRASCLLWANLVAALQSYIVTLKGKGTAFIIDHYRERTRTAYGWKMATEERQFAISGNWALGADGLQWILYRRRSEKRGGWEALSFVRTSRDILARCMREKGCPDADSAVLLAGLQWVKALNHAVFA